MILAIDVGNTNIVVGCIDDRKTYFIERLSTNRTKTELEYAVDLKNVLDIYHIKKKTHKSPLIELFMLIFNKVMIPFKAIFLISLISTLT